MIDKDIEIKIRNSLSVSLEEAIKLRFSIDIPGSYASPQEVIELLLSVRKIADRLEELYLACLQLKGEVSRNSTIDKAVADNNWAKAISTLNNSGSAHMDSFSGPRERYAEADLMTFESQRTAQRSANLTSYTSDVVESLNVALRGVNNTRQDLLTWLRTLSFQSHLES